MQRFIWLALAQGLLFGVTLTAAAEPAREIEVVVDHGYAPEEIEVRAGEHVRLRFVRHDHSGCTREVVFPSLGLRRDLPPGQPVVIDLGRVPAGVIEFHCGMKMVHGRVVAR